MPDLTLVGSPEPDDHRELALFHDVGGDMLVPAAEADLQDAVESLCRFYNLDYHHCWRARGDKGFPDLVILGPNGGLFRELKVQGRQPFDEQKRWGRHMRNVGWDWAIWTEDDWASGRISSELAAISYLGTIGQLPRAV